MGRWHALRKPMAAALIAGGLLLLCWRAYERVQSLWTAPDVSFVTVQGEHLRLSDLRGGPVLITFWASDCGPCLSEIPDLDKLQREWSTRGLQLIAVAMRYDLPSRVWSLVQSARPSYRVVLDSSGALAAAFGRVSAVPTTFLIAPDGTLRERLVGPIDFATVRHHLFMMLGDF